jgi:Family of unknown function (DUF6069)
MATQTPEMRIPAGELEAAGRRAPVGWRRLLAVGTGTVLASTVANVVVALALANWLQVPAVFTPLRTSSVASLTVVGVAGAVLVFAALTRLHPNPVGAFRVVATVGLVISWAPDLLVWATHPFPGTTAPGVLSLMSLHVVAAGLAVLLLGQYGPASSRRGK